LVRRSTNYWAPPRTKSSKPCSAEKIPVSHFRRLKCEWKKKPKSSNPSLLLPNNLTFFVYICFSFASQRTQDSRDHFLAGLKSAGLSTQKLNIVPPENCTDGEKVTPAFAELRFFDVCNRYQEYLSSSPLAPELELVTALYNQPVIDVLHARLFDPVFTASKSASDQADFVEGLYEAICVSAKISFWTRCLLSLTNLPLSTPNRLHKSIITIISRRCAQSSMK
jgi:hypothetical protein